jgi:hypothetical protein
LPTPKPDLDEADEDGEHAGERDRLRRVVSGDHQGDDRREDQRSERRVGAEHEDLRRAHQGVAHETGDRGVQPVHRRQPGQFGVGHALGHEDRRQHDARDEVGSQPPALVGPQ